MGDLKTGLYIGATLQLMTLGISSFGGASVPDYQTAALVGSYIAISTKQDASIGITLAIPVAMLMVQLDVLKWSINIYLLKLRITKELRECTIVEYCVRCVHQEFRYC